MMKKSLFLFSFILISLSSSAQFLEDGKYSYSADGFTLHLEVCDDGWEICNMGIVYLEEDWASDLTGEWFKVNMNGVDDDYDGPEGWYQVEDSGTYYEIDFVSSTTITLRGLVEGEDLLMTKD
jgi:hypothetical protein